MLYKRLFKSLKFIVTTTLNVHKCLASDVASAAMDGVAPEWVQDGPLREERHERGTPVEMWVLAFR